jgi:hypothetical protein
MRVHRTGVLVLLAFIAVFALALDVRIGIAAVIAATVIDWLFIVVPLSRVGTKSDGRSSR